MGQSATGNVLENLGGLLMQYSADKMQAKSDAKRREAEAALKRQYEEQIVDPDQTRIEGKQEVRYNKFGAEINRRTLAQEEIEARRMELEERRAKTQRATAEAEAASVEAEYKPRVLDSTLESQAAARDASRASAESSRASAETTRARLSLDERKYEEGITSAMQEKINSAEQLLYAAAQGPDASAQQKAELLRAQLEAAKTKGDEMEINRLLNRIQGELKLPMARELEAIKNSGGLGGATVNVPSLDLGG